MSSQISSIISQKDPIAYRAKEFNPIANRNPIGLDSKTVDVLLQEYSDLITASYVPWFAKRFYKMDREFIRRLASEARADGRDPRWLFIHLIKKNS